jgi:hemerythrin
MNQFNLPDRCELGVKNLDDQHQQLIDIIESLYDHINDRSLTEAEKKFSAFQKTLVRHFADEETLMAETDFPNLSAHSAHHRELLVEADKIFGDIKNRGQLNQFDINEVLDKLLRYMLVTDGPFNTHLRQISYPKTGQAANDEDDINTR